MVLKCIVHCDEVHFKVTGVTAKKVSQKVYDNL